MCFNCWSIWLKSDRYGMEIPYAMVGKENGFRQLKSDRYGMEIWYDTNAKLLKFYG